jgi:hypothetical protein
MIRFRVCTTLVTALLLIGVSSAQAQIVAFSQLRDAASGKFFDAATSEPFAANANRLNIGFNTGSDPTTFVSNAFHVTTLAFGNRSASDTISFVVTAPANFYIASLAYTQQGTSSTVRTAVQSGNTQWTVAGIPAILGEYNNPNLTGTIDLNALQLGSVAVSITASLFAGPTGDMEIVSANVVAEIKPLPAGPVVPRDPGAPGGILQGGPNGGGQPPAAGNGRGRDEDEARRGNSGSGRGEGGRESGRGSGR